MPPLWWANCFFKNHLLAFQGNVRQNILIPTVKSAALPLCLGKILGGSLKVTGREFSENLGAFCQSMQGRVLTAQRGLDASTTRSNGKPSIKVSWHLFTPHSINGRKNGKLPNTIVDIAS